MGMGIVIAKTIIATLDIVLTIIIIIGTDNKTEAHRALRVGAVVWTALNIAAMWL